MLDLLLVALLHLGQLFLVPRVLDAAVVGRVDVRILQAGWLAGRVRLFTLIEQEIVILDSDTPLNKDLQKIRPSMTRIRD